MHRSAARRDRAEMERKETTLPESVQKVRRGKKRAAYDEASIHAVLDAARLVHVGVVREAGEETYPVVLPMIFGRVGDTLYLHGSVSTGLFKAAGTRVCLTATILDGLVLARSVFHHSANYRSCAVFGTAEIVEDPDEVRRALVAITEHLTPGQWDRTREPDRNELLQTRVARVRIERASVKARVGPPVDDPKDVAPASEYARTWAGVVPLRMVAGEPVADDFTPDGAEVPPAAAANPNFS